MVMMNNNLIKPFEEKGVYQNIHLIVKNKITPICIGISIAL